MIIIPKETIINGPIKVESGKMCACGCSGGCGNGSSTKIQSCDDIKGVPSIDTLEMYWKSRIEVEGITIPAEYDNLNIDNLYKHAFAFLELYLNIYESFHHYGKEIADMQTAKCLGLTYTYDFIDGEKVNSHNLRHKIRQLNDVKKELIDELKSDIDDLLNGSSTDFITLSSITKQMSLICKAETFSEILMSFQDTPHSLADAIGHLTTSVFADFEIKGKLIHNNVNRYSYTVGLYSGLLISNGIITSPETIIKFIS